MESWYNLNVLNILNKNHKIYDNIFCKISKLANFV